jgi:hypothetical protein
MDSKLPTKWTGKRIGQLSLALGVMAFAGWKIFQDLIKDQDSSYIYSFIFGVAAIFIAATSIPKSRSFIVENLKAVFAVGCAIIALSAAWLASSIFYIVTHGDESLKFSSDIVAYGFCGLFFIGSMIAGSPKAIRKAQEMRGSFEKDAF